MKRFTHLPLLLAALLAAAVLSPPGLRAENVTGNLNINLAPQGNYNLVLSGDGTPATAAYADETDYSDVVFKYRTEVYSTNNPNTPVQTVEGTFDPATGASPSIVLAKGQNYKLRTCIWTSPANGSADYYNWTDPTVSVRNLVTPAPHHAKIIAFDESETGILNGPLNMTVTARPLTAELRVVATDAPSCPTHPGGYPQIGVAFVQPAQSYNVNDGTTTRGQQGMNICTPVQCPDGNTLLLTDRVLCPDEQTMAYIALVMLDDDGNSLNMVGPLQVPLRQNYRTTLYGNFFSACDHPVALPTMEVSMSLDVPYDVVHDVAIGDGSGAFTDLPTPWKADQPKKVTAILTRQPAENLPMGNPNGDMGTEILERQELTVDGDNVTVTFTPPLPPEGKTHADYLYNGIIFADQDPGHLNIVPNEQNPQTFNMDYRPLDDETGMDMSHHTVYGYFEGFYSEDTNSWSVIPPAAQPSSPHTGGVYMIRAGDDPMMIDSRVHHIRLHRPNNRMVTFPAQGADIEIPIAELSKPYVLTGDKTDLGEYYLPNHHVHGTPFLGLEIRFYDAADNLLGSVDVSGLAGYGGPVDQLGNRTLVRIYGDLYRQAGLQLHNVITADDLVGKVAGCIVKRADFGDREFNNTYARFEANGAPNKVKLTGLRWRPLHYYNYTQKDKYRDEPFPLTFTIVGDSLVLDCETIDGMLLHHAVRGEESRYYCRLGDKDILGVDPYTTSNSQQWPRGFRDGSGPYNDHLYQRWASKITVNDDGSIEIDFNHPDHPLVWSKYLGANLFSDHDALIAGYRSYSETSAMGGGGFYTQLKMHVYEPNYTFTGRAYPNSYPVSTPGVIKLGRQADGHNLHVLNMCGEGWPMLQADGTRHWVYGDIDYENYEVRIPRQPVQPFPMHKSGSTRLVTKASLSNWIVRWTDVNDDQPAVTTTYLQSRSGGDIIGRDHPYYAHDNHDADAADDVAVQLWDVNEGGTLNTRLYHHIKFEEPWNTVTGFRTDDVEFTVTMDDWVLPDEPATAAMDNQILDYGYSATGGLYVKGIVRLGANADLVDHIEVYAMPDVTTSIDAYDDMLSQADGIAGALNISAYPTDFNMEQSGAPLLYPDADGNILYNQHARPEYVEQQTASAPRRAASNGGFSHFADRVPGHTVYVKTIYKEDTGLAPTFHAMAAKDAVTTSVDDIPWAQPVTQVTIGRGQVTVSGTDAVAIHNVSGQQVYSGATGTVSLPSGIYLVQGRGLRPAKAVVR